MRTITYRQRNYRAAIAKLDRRAEPAEHVRKTVSEIMGAIAKDGDAALIRYAKKFDKVALTPETLTVSESEFAAAL